LLGPEVMEYGDESLRELFEHLACPHFMYQAL